MSVTIDSDTERLVQFMQTNFPAAKLRSMADAVSALAPVLWERYGREDFTVLSVDAPSPSAEQTPTDAS